ncbi:MFS transporter [Bacillus pseudomycoides]|uniref:MFS transporter n=1 Tax=Bacillus pseudomycoides TaxID=64104 RepID=UPI001FB1A34D|nr:MFS transporter [Bacillus pseudomycoides]
MGFINQYRGLGKSVYTLFLVNFINYTGNFVYPFLVLILGSVSDLNSKTTGTIMMAVSIAFVPGSMLGGKLADTIGRKKILILSMSLKALIFILCALYIDYIYFLIILLVLASFIGGLSGPSFGAIVADLTNKEDRKVAFSLLYLGVNLGMGISPMLAGFFYKYSITALFVGDAVTLLLAVYLIYKNVPETFQRINDKKFKVQKENSKKEGLVRILLKTPVLLGFLPVLLAYYFIYSQHSFSLPLQMDKYFFEQGPSIFGIIMAVNAVVVIVLTSFVTLLTKKLTDITIIALSGILLGGGFGLVGIATTVPSLIISTIIWTIGEIMFATNSGAFVANVTPSQYRGRINSIVSITRSAGLAIGPWAMGYYIDFFNLHSVWGALLVVGIAYCIGAYALNFIIKREKTTVLKRHA